MISQIFAMVILIAIGIPLSYWVRKAQLDGFELWLPFGIIIGIAISPVAGFFFAIIMKVGAWFVFPFDLNTLGILTFDLAVTMFMITLLSFTPATLVFYSVLLVVFFNIISNILFLFLGFDPMKSMKFAAFSIWLTWLITSNWGWGLVEFFSI